MAAATTELRNRLWEMSVEDLCSILIKTKADANVPKQGDYKSEDEYKNALIDHYINVHIFGGGKALEDISYAQERAVPTAATPYTAPSAQGVDKVVFKLAEGLGVWTSSHGDKYSGEMANKSANGYGTIEHTNGDIYRGQWIEDKRHGRGVYIFKKGHRYSGEFVDSKREGLGVFVYSSGDKYIGEFKAGRRDGLGVFTTTGGKGGERRREEGKWKEGRFIEATEVDTRKALEVATDCEDVADRAETKSNRANELAAPKEPNPFNIFVRACGIVTGAFLLLTCVVELFVGGTLAVASLAFCSGVVAILIIIMEAKVDYIIAVAKAMGIAQVRSILYYMAASWAVGLGYVGYIACALLVVVATINLCFGYSEKAFNRAVRYYNDKVTRQLAEKRAYEAAYGASGNTLLSSSYAGHPNGVQYSTYGSDQA